MTDLADFAALVARDNGLGVVSTLRADNSIQSSVVNVGVPACARGDRIAGPCCGPSCPAGRMAGWLR